MIITKAKVFLLVLLTLFCLGATVNAAPTIRADQQYYDFREGLHVLKGNVYIEVKNRIITAGQAKVSVSTLEVWGSGGITVTQDDIYFSGDTVHVYGSSDRAAIEGNIVFSRTNVKISADRVDFNWRDKIAVFSGNVQVTDNGNVFSGDTVRYNVVTSTFL